MNRLTPNCLKVSRVLSSSENPQIPPTTQNLLFKAPSPSTNTSTGGVRDHGPIDHVAQIIHASECVFQGSVSKSYKSQKFDMPSLTKPQICMCRKSREAYHFPADVTQSGNQFSIQISP